MFSVLEVVVVIDFAFGKDPLQISLLYLNNTFGVVHKVTLFFLFFFGPLFTPKPFSGISKGREFY
jgi:hypothetical protein